MSAIGFSVNEAQAVIEPLFLFVAGIIVYAIFIFKFYRFIASRDIFKLNLQKYSESFFGFLEKLLSGIFYIIEYLIVFPFITFFWFGILAFVMMALSKAEVGVTLMISMALVAAIRISAYYNEDLSKDLAKMLPFALLGVFLVDISYFSYDNFISRVISIPSLWKQLVYYLAFVILLEFLLRIIYSIARPFMKEEG